MTPWSFCLLSPSFSPLCSTENPNQNVKYDFYEQGVVRFRNSETDAIEPARVLIGILAGLVNSIPKLNNHELYGKLLLAENTKIDQYVGNESSIKNEKRLEVLPALTLGKPSAGGELFEL